jgi:integrase
VLAQPVAQEGADVLQPGVAALVRRRARSRRRLPVVLTTEEVRGVLERLDGVESLVAGLLYGSGLRLMEALRLRVQDLDFNRRELTVRDGKSGKDRRTLLPDRVAEQLGSHLQTVRRPSSLPCP